MDDSSSSSSSSSSPSLVLLLRLATGKETWREGHGKMVWRDLSREIERLLRVIMTNAVHMEDGDEAVMEMLLDLPDADADAELMAHPVTGDDAPVPTRYQVLTPGEKLMVTLSLVKRIRLFDLQGEGPPFTLQRFCELLLSSPTWPDKGADAAGKKEEDPAMQELRRLPAQYKTFAKWTRAIFKSLLVTSSTEDYRAQVDVDAAAAYTTAASRMDAMGMQHESIRPKTPLFSPIPFLQGGEREEVDGISEIDLDVRDMGHVIHEDTVKRQRPEAHTNGVNGSHAESSPPQDGGHDLLQRTPTGGQVDELDLVRPTDAGESGTGVSGRVGSVGTATGTATGTVSPMLGTGMPGTGEATETALPPHPTPASSSADRNLSAEAVLERARERNAPLDHDAVA